MRSAWIRHGSLFAAAAILLAVWVGTPGVASAATNCSTAANPIVCENQLPGTAPSQWQIKGMGDSTIQGYATQMSVDVGHTIYFKVKTPSSDYVINIYRLGYYGGDGARLIASNITPSASLPQPQPACLKSSRTGEIDCGNWSVSASWSVPNNAVSGVYLAELVRQDPQDPGGKSEIPFVVRNDASHSAILVPTDDATWQAYNDYGGNSLYSCTVSCPTGHPGGYKGAYAVSYNRPWDGSIKTDAGQSYLWYAEYQMIRWLEKQGFNVSYTSDVQLGTGNPRLLRNHRVILLSGHDEYWSGSERANVTAARNAGVNIALFTGATLFWKTRWAPSIDSSATRNRTLITYKETHFNKQVDPADPPTWTGTWADPRFSPPADGGRPGNSLTGQVLAVNSGTSDITVPYQYHALPLWAHTSVANLRPGHHVTLGAGDGTLGYEWGVAPDNGFQPAGLFNLSSTTVHHVEAFSDYGTDTTRTTLTHHLTLYRASSGALVFDAATVQWSWGLSNVNAWGRWNTRPSSSPPDRNMEQFTVNLLSLMGVQPGSLQSGLVRGPSASSGRAPLSKVTNPRNGRNVADGSKVRVTGTATDPSGKPIGGVEVSTDGGHSWHPATLRTPDKSRVRWSYTWIAHGYPGVRIMSRAVDAYGHLGRNSRAISVRIHCPCSLWGTHMGPASVPFGYANSTRQRHVSAEVGMRFTTRINSKITGLRFYKSRANTGTHVGSVWTNNRHLLAQGTFTHESRSGWQTLIFSKPVLLKAHHTYVVGYFDPHGHYSYTIGWFYPNPAPTAMGGATNKSGPWSAVINIGKSVNGLFRYTNSPRFPRKHFRATNYWVDPILVPTATHHPVRHNLKLHGRSTRVGNQRARLIPHVNGTLRGTQHDVCVPPKSMVTFKLTTARLRHGTKTQLHHEELLLGHHRKASKRHGRMVIRLRHLRAGRHTVTAKLLFIKHRTIHAHHRTIRAHRTMRFRFRVC